MERGAVSSSQIKSIGHDAETNTLEVEFNNGSVYQYDAVTRDAYLALMSAGSIGSHFNGHVKGAYTYKRVS